MDNGELLARVDERTESILRELKDVNDQMGECNLHLQTLNGTVAENSTDIAVINERCKLNHSNKFRKIGWPSGIVVVVVYVVYSLGAMLGWWPEI